MSTIGRINELVIIQANHSPGDSISLGKNVKKVTIRNQPSSGGTAYVAWNTSKSKINELAIGDSATYTQEDIILDGNRLYILFDDTTAGGKVLVSIINDTKQDCP